MVIKELDSVRIDDRYQCEKTLLHDQLLWRISKSELKGTEIGFARVGATACKKLNVGLSPFQTKVMADSILLML